MAERPRKQSRRISAECPSCGKAFSYIFAGPLAETERLCPVCRLDKGSGSRDTEKRVLGEATRELKLEADISPEKKEINVVERELAMRELLNRKLLAFVLRHQPSYLAGWFHKDLAQRLEQFAIDVELKRSPRLLLQVPPRLGKSLLASQYFPAWFLGRNPEMEIIASSYAVSLASGFSKKVRELIRSKEYQNAFPKTKLHPDDQSAESWRTTLGGGLLAAGVGGPITGRGAHCLIIDDAIKNAEEAESETTREAIKQWYQSVAYTRLAPGGGVIAIGTRWHFDDLLGWLERQSESEEGDIFEVIRYPMIAVEDEPYRHKGEALHPERYDTQAAERIRKAVGPRTWAALYQQNPTLDEGAYFSRDMFRYYTGEPPRRLTHYATFDLAVSQKERADYTVGVVVGVDSDDDIYVLDLVRGRWDTHRIAEEIIEVHKIYQPEIIGIEKGSLQLAIGPYLDRRIAEERLYDINIHPIPPGRRDKEARARAIQGRMRQGKVYWPKDASWLDDLQTEFLQFPMGIHDDQVDAVAYVGLLLSEIVARPYKASGVAKIRDWANRLHQYVEGNERRRKTPMSA